VPVAGGLRVTGWRGAHDRVVIAEALPYVYVRTAEGRRHFGLAVGTGNGEIELLGGGVC